METRMDFEMFKEMPGYKAILKAVLKAQIQMLVEQLSDTEEESIILTASLSDGTLCHLGSSSGKNFLDGREDIKSQFLFHCLKSKTSTSVPNQDEIFIPDDPEANIMQHSQGDRPPKKPRTASPTAHAPFGRGSGALRGSPVGWGFPVGRGAAVGRGSPFLRGVSKRGLGSGRAKRSRGHFPTHGRGRGINTPNPNATATETRPTEELRIESSPLKHDNSGAHIQEPDLVTVKAENFELNIDLNSPTRKSKDTEKGAMSASAKQSHKKVPIPTMSDQSLISTPSYTNAGDDNCVVGLNTSADSDENADNSLGSLVHIKQETPDDLDAMGMQAGSSGEMYGMPGPSGTMHSQSFGPVSSGGMMTDSFSSADGQNDGSLDNSSESTNNSSLMPEFHFLDEYGNLKIPATRKYAFKRKLSQKTIAEKYLAVLEVEKGEMSKTEIARTFSVPLSTLSGWVKDAESIKDAFGKFGPGRCTKRKGNFQELEDELLKWCAEKLFQNIQLSGPIILERARQLVIQMDIKDCKLSSGWLDRFKERHGIRFKKVQGQMNIPDAILNAFANDATLAGMMPNPDQTRMNPNPDQSVENSVPQDKNSAGVNNLEGTGHELDIPKVYYPEETSQELDASKDTGPYQDQLLKYFATN